MASFRTDFKLVRPTGQAFVVTLAFAGLPKRSLRYVQPNGRRREVLEVGRVRSWAQCSLHGVQPSLS